MRTAAKPLVPYPEGCSHERPGSYSGGGGGGSGTVNGGGPAAGHSATLQTPAPGADPLVRLCPACCGRNGVLVWEPCGQLSRQHSVTETSAPAVDEPSGAFAALHSGLASSRSSFQSYNVAAAGAGGGQTRVMQAAARIYSSTCIISRCQYYNIGLLLCRRRRRPAPRRSSCCRASAPPRRARRRCLCASCSLRPPPAAQVCVRDVC